MVLSIYGSLFQILTNFGCFIKPTGQKFWQTATENNSQVVEVQKERLDLLVRWICLNYLLIVLYITVLLSTLFYYCWCEINMLSSELLGLVRFTMKYFYLLTYIHHSTYLVFFKDFLKIWNQNQKCQFKQFKMQWSFICLS